MKSVILRVCVCPQGDFTWSSVSGRSVDVKPVPLQSLSELERSRLQEVAFRRLLRDCDLGRHITIPKCEHRTEIDHLTFEDAWQRSQRLFFPLFYLTEFLFDRTFEFYKQSEFVLVADLNVNKTPVCLISSQVCDTSYLTAFVPLKSRRVKHFINMTNMSKPCWLCSATYQYTHIHPDLAVVFFIDAKKNHSCQTAAVLERSTHL